VFDFEPIHQDRRMRLEELRCWDGRPLLPHLKSELVRELDRLELVMSQLTELEAERNHALQVKSMPCTSTSKPPISRRCCGSDRLRDRQRRRRCARGLRSP
jgi:transposase